MKRAVVVAGGGAKGGFSAGVLYALWNREIQFDILVGVSVGALNVAVPPYNLPALWRSIRGRSDIYRRHWSFFLKLGRAKSLYTTAPLRKLLDEHINIGWLRSGRKEFRFVVTDLESGSPLTLSQEDPPLLALMASSALPGLFPPVEVGGKVFVDGGISMNAPVKVAMDLGADEVTVILHGPESVVREAPGGNALDIASRALEIAIRANVTRDLAMARRVNALLEWAQAEGISLKGSPFQKYRLRRLRVITPRRPLAGGLLTFDPRAIKADLEAGLKAGRSAE